MQLYYPNKYGKLLNFNLFKIGIIQFLQWIWGNYELKIEMFEVYTESLFW